MIFIDLYTRDSLSRAALLTYERMLSYSTKSQPCRALPVQATGGVSAIRRWLVHRDREIMPDKASLDIFNNSCKSGRVAMR
jgi:hypothetical protein